MNLEWLFLSCRVVVNLLDMMAKNSRYSGVYYGNAVETTGEIEGSSSSGRFHNEITVSEDSSVPTRRCISLNSCRDDTFGVPL